MKFCRINKWPFISVLIFISLSITYSILFYPKQYIDFSTVRLVPVETPEFNKYHNDCLHPCIRRDENDGFIMVQSPYYKWNNRVENPILYHSQSYTDWTDGIEVAPTPDKGYNSDPNVYVENDTIYIFWRECGTTLCDSLNVANATVGVTTTDYHSFSNKRIYLLNSSTDYDVEQAPTLLKKDGKYLFYSTWYQYFPTRRNIGISIWEGTSLLQPDFTIKDTISFDKVITVDKFVQKQIFDRIIYLPFPAKFDLWHFDLVQYQDNLIMVSSSEKGDNIMLSYSKDGKRFKTLRKPLINNHYMENKVKYRQYYYKPTAIVENDTLNVFFTTNGKSSGLNELFISKIAISELFK